jgi:uncharacterized protein YcbX
MGMAAPPGTFFDFAPIHLITTSTLARIAELSPRGRIEVDRYRPNIVVDTPGFPASPRTTGSAGACRSARWFCAS